MLASGLLVRELDVPPATLRRLAAENPARYPALFESAVPGPLSRCSILGAFPRSSLALDRDRGLSGMGFQPNASGFLDALERWWLADREAAASDWDPFAFATGWAVFLGYELAMEIEPHLRLPP